MLHAMELEREYPRLDAAVDRLQQRPVGMPGD